MRSRGAYRLLVLLLALALAGTAGAQFTSNVVTYRINNVFGPASRSSIAATGADIFEVGPNYVLVAATADEAKALSKLGFTLDPLVTAQAFPPADSNYHDYAEMVTELQQAAIDHPAIFSLFSIGVSYEGRTI